MPCAPPGGEFSAPWPLRTIPLGSRRALGRLRLGEAHRFSTSRMVATPSAPKPSRPGPGRPTGSKNKHRARRHNVEKTAKRAKTIKTTKPAQGKGQAQFRPMSRLQRRNDSPSNSPRRAAPTNDHRAAGQLHPQRAPLKRDRLLPSQFRSAVRTCNQRQQRLPLQKPQGQAT